MMIKIITKTPEELTYIGKRMAKFLTAGDLVALDGDLGAGKTTLSQGIAQGLDIAGIVNSPTFTIVHEYNDGRLPFYHFDVYRLQQPQELEDIGYEDYFYGEGVTVVEWANMIDDYLPEEYLQITINHHQQGRELALKAIGRHYEQIVEELCGCDYAKYR